MVTLMIRCHSAFTRVGQSQRSWRSRVAQRERVSAASSSKPHSKVLPMASAGCLNKSRSLDVMEASWVLRKNEAHPSRLV